MLTSAGCRERRTRLWQCLPESAAWLLIGDPRHVQYFCGFRVNPISFSADQRPLLLLLRDGRAVLLADNFLKRSCTTAYHVDEEIIVSWYAHRTSVSNRDECLLTALRGVAPLWQGSPGLVERQAVPHMVTDVLPVVQDQFLSETTGRPTSLGDAIRLLRRCKLDDEMQLLRRCMRACEAGHQRAFDVIRAGVSERDVYLEVQAAAERAAGQPCVVYGDFRATSSQQHKAGGHPTSYELRSGDVFILDYSVVIDGYRSDFTNTIAVTEPTTVQQKQFEACRAALHAAEAVLKAGVAARDVWQSASRILEQWGFGALAHHAGHGLGLEHPEPPVLVSESDDVLLEGDVVTLEPGCYVPGVCGMRFEHNYRITADGCERLSHHRIGLTADAP